MFDEESSMPVASPVYGDFEEDFGTPLYDEYEDIFLEEEGIKWDVSSCVSNLESLYQEEPSSLDFVENIPCEMQERKQGLYCGIQDEAVRPQL